MRSLAGRPAGTRGQSETIAVVLMLALTIAGAGVVVAFGSVALDDAQRSATTGNAEHGMTQFDSRASLVAHGETDAQRVDLGGADDASRVVDGSRGWMNVTVVNTTDDTVETQVMNVTLGAVVYEDGRDTIAYQGGGVWRKTGSGNGSTMLSPPEFHYRGTTLTLPLVLVRGDGTVDKRARITRDGPTSAKYPNASQDRLNPLTGGQVNVTVHSAFYQAWGRFFEQRTAGDVAYDHPNETVTITLITPGSVDTVSRAITGSSGSDEFSLQGNGANPSFVDSYNASEGDYSQTKSGNGTVQVAGSVDMSGNSKIKGDLRSGADVDMSGGANVTRTVYWTTSFSASGSATYGGEEQIDGVDSADSIDSYVRDEVDSLQSDNDNGATDAIDGSPPRLNFSGSNSVTLSGNDGTRYYLDKIDTDKKLIVETDGETVRIGVGNDVQLQSASGNITVKGSGSVRFYTKADVTFEKGTSVYVPDDDARKAWFYGTSDTDFDMQGSSGNPIRVVGVLYATDPEATATIKHADLYGGVAVGKVTIDNGGAVHYDQSLGSVSVLPGTSSIPRVTYLHVSTNPITVENG